MRKLLCMAIATVLFFTTATAQVKDTCCKCPIPPVKNTAGTNKTKIHVGGATKATVNDINLTIVNNIPADSTQSTPEPVTATKNNIIVVPGSKNSGSESNTGLILAIVAIVAICIGAFFMYGGSGSTTRRRTRGTVEQPWNNQTAQILTTNGGWGSFSAPDGTRVVLNVNTPTEPTTVNAINALYNGSGLRPLPSYPATNP